MELPPAAGGISGIPNRLAECEARPDIRETTMGIYEVIGLLVLFGVAILAGIFVLLRKLASRR